MEGVSIPLALGRVHTPNVAVGKMRLKDGRRVSHQSLSTVSQQWKLGSRCSFES